MKRTRKTGTSIEKRKNKNGTFNFRVKYFQDGFRKSVTFGTLTDAESFCSSINIARSLPGNMDFSVDGLLHHARFQQVCNNLNINIVDGYSEAINILTAKHAKKSAVTLAGAIRQFLISRKKTNCREPTINEYTHYLTKIEKAIGADIPIDAVDEAALAQIVHKCTTISVREHCSKTVKAFFSFCMEQYKLEKNPTTNIKVEKIKKDELPPSVLPPAKIKEIFETLPQKANILATFALLAFAGLRPEEVCTKTSKKCIGWEDINFQTKVITVSGATSKIRRLRTLNELPDNLWAFLALTAPGQRHGPVCDISYSTLRRIRRKVLGKAPQDIFRHCFASYGYHYLAPHLVIEILGHVRQFKTFEKYYKGQADQKSAKEYFSIFPNVS